MHFLFFIFVLFIFSLATRLYNIAIPDYVCWDECHFGKMINFYLNNTFFLDVHPPLGKLLLTLSAYLNGYAGNFSFSQPGLKYSENIPYIKIRMFVSFFASLVPILCFLVVFKLTSNYKSSFLCYLLAMCDTALLTMGRFILLDSFLYVFILSALYTCISYLFIKPFTYLWFLNIFLTGCFMAFAISVKFIGLFVIILIGFMTFSQLWQLFGNQSISLTTIIKQIVVYICGLVILPAFIYISLFAFSFSLLYKSGASDGFFSSQFQKDLIGNELNSSYAFIDVPYNVNVSLKTYQTFGFYLHSHSDSYPIGDDDELWQVTSYPHKDENNYWILHRLEKPKNTNINCIQDGDVIYLEHFSTKRLLCVANYSSPVTQGNYLIANCDESEFLDDKEKFLFKVNLENAKSDCLVSIATKFSLFNEMLSCQMYTDDITLPIWAFEQREVSCQPKFDKINLWNIEQVFLSDDEKKQLLKMNMQLHFSFFEKLIEYHAVMFKGNNQLKVGKDEVHSSPWQWPINHEAHQISGSDHPVFIVGNPVIWLSSFIVLTLYAFFSFGSSCYTQRLKAFSIDDSNKTVVVDEVQFDSKLDETFKLRKEVIYSKSSVNKNVKKHSKLFKYSREETSDLKLFKSNQEMGRSKLFKDNNKLVDSKLFERNRKERNNLMEICDWLLFGWFIHYFPFWIMRRVLYLHHYLPALLFSIMLNGIIINHVIELIGKRLKKKYFIEELLYCFICAIYIYSFLCHSHLSYGTSI